MSTGNVQLFVDRVSRVYGRRAPSGYDGSPVTYLSLTEGGLDVCLCGPPDQVRALLDRLVAAADALDLEPSVLL